MPDYPDEKWMRDVCRIGQGVLACRYLMTGDGGLSCEKLTEIHRLLDQRADSGRSLARGDNCPGKDPR